MSEIQVRTERYIGVKIVDAGAMTRGDYNTYRGWKMPEDENPADDGYIVIYETGYVSWCPKVEFENANRKTSGMTFGMAIEAMKKGLKVARAGWNGKGMFLILVKGTDNAELREETPYHSALNNDAGGQSHVTINPHIDMFTATGEMQPGWLASQTDMLSEDWNII